MFLTTSCLGMLVLCSTTTILVCAYSFSNHDPPSQRTPRPPATTKLVMLYPKQLLVRDVGMIV